MAPPAELHVCFVCTGNICRSPIAEKVLDAELVQAGLDGRVRVTSAGTGGWHVGNPADPRTAALLRAHGYPDTHTARQLDAELLAADLIVALDNEHRRILQGKVPEPERVRLLRSFDPSAPPGADVPDPYYGADDGFVLVLGMVRAAMPGLVAWIRDELG
ncbi:low molecular weight protein-tyrosine-phosphatase [Pseudonocardia sp.]|uniref:low molecular weight protein-tyrosine-phosphatase n=1 Tax=Pseudonocardia sp. TaxID=60912 RepID=UPI003D104024